MEFFNDFDIKPPPEDMHMAYEDAFDGEFHAENYDYDELMYPQMPLEKIFEECLIPTLEQILPHIGKLIIWCAIFRVLTQTSSKVPMWLNHWISFGIGMLLLLHFFYSNVIFQVLLPLAAWLMLHVAHKIGYGCRGLLTAILCVSFNMICELFFTSPVDWHQVRGVQIVISMKVISLAFDMDADVSAHEIAQATQKPEEEEEPEENLSKKDVRKRKFLKSKMEGKDGGRPEKAVDETDSMAILRVPTLGQYLGYALCPGTTVFGPWVSYKEYLSIYVNPHWNPGWMTKIIFSMTISFLFFTISTCWISWLIPELSPKPIHNWLWAYRNAMQFRAGHYFVSFVSEASAVTAGFGYKPPDEKSSRSRWEVPVCEPHNIEVPRSLVDVVISWNIPMHRWLKKYCFKKTISYGRWTAVMTTFLASTFLHGFNFQLGAVLLSLGFFTFTEEKVRSKLARLFNAAIEARKSEDNAFRHREAAFLVMMANLLFGLLAAAHLIYLGVMFDTSDLQAEGYRWTHTIEKWASLGFFSHYFFISAFLLSFCM